MSTQAVPEKTIMVSFVQASKDVTPARYYRLVSTDGVSMGFEGKIVDSLPEEGDPHYIYLVKKATTAQGNAYDEWMWVLKPNETYGWEYIGGTGEVTVKLYKETGENSDGAMTQKAVTDALKELEQMISESGGGEGVGTYTSEEWANFWR